MTTPQLNLPYLVASQAQKEVTHNEALNDLDVLVQPSVISGSLSSPPASPADGDAYLVAASASGAWAGHENALAFYFSGWKFKTPRKGWTLYDANEDAFLLFDGSGWLPRAIEAETSWTPGAIASGAGVVSGAISLSGASFGDAVFVGAPYALQGVTATASVSAANAVVLCLFNGTGANVTLGAGTWKIRIIRK